MLMSLSILATMSINPNVHAMLNTSSNGTAMQNDDNGTTTCINLEDCGDTLGGNIDGGTNQTDTPL